VRGRVESFKPKENEVMKKLLVTALIVPVALLLIVRPAKASDKAAAVLTGVAVGIGAALILDAVAPRPVVAAPVVYAPAPAPVMYQPAPVIVTPPPVVYAPPVVYTPAPVVYPPAPVVVHAPRHVCSAPRPAYHRAGHGKGHRKDKHGHGNGHGRHDD
jgi:hypothetical protein